MARFSDLPVFQQHPRGQHPGTPVPNYIGDAPTSLVFGGNASIFYVADGANLWGSTNFGPLCFPQHRTSRRSISCGRPQSNSSPTTVSMPCWSAASTMSRTPRAEPDRRGAERWRRQPERLGRVWPRRAEHDRQPARLQLERGRSGGQPVRPRHLDPVRRHQLFLDRHGAAVRPGRQQLHARHVTARRQPAPHQVRHRYIHGPVERQPTAAAPRSAPAPCRSAMAAPQVPSRRRHRQRRARLQPLRQRDLWRRHLRHRIAHPGRLRDAHPQRRQHLQRRHDHLGRHPAVGNGGTTGSSLATSSTTACSPSTAPTA